MENVFICLALRGVETIGSTDYIHDGRLYMGNIRNVMGSFSTSAKHRLQDMSSHDKQNLHSLQSG